MNEKPVLMRTVGRISMEMTIVMMLTIMMMVVKHEGPAKRHKTKSDPKTRGLPPPPGGRRNPAWTPAVVIVRVTPTIIIIRVRRVVRVIVRISCGRRSHRR